MRGGDRFRVSTYIAYDKPPYRPGTVTIACIKEFNIAVIQQLLVIVAQVDFVRLAVIRRLRFGAGDARDEFDLVAVLKSRTKIN